jgi:hypothetical protein
MVQIDYFLLKGTICLFMVWSKIYRVSWIQMLLWHEQSEWHSEPQFEIKKRGYQKEGQLLGVLGRTQYIEHPWDRMLKLSLGGPKSPWLICSLMFPFTVTPCVGGVGQIWIRGCRFTTPRLQPVRPWPAFLYPFLLLMYVLHWWLQMAGWP